MQKLPKNPETLDVDALSNEIPYKMYADGSSSMLYHQLLTIRYLIHLI